jgi:signal transduction histidine kinase
MGREDWEGSGEVSEAEHSASRTLRSEPEPNDWLDALLDMALTAPDTRNTSALVDVFLKQLAELIPECALGACIVDPGTGTSITYTRLPLGQTAEPLRSPARLFPAYAAEHVVPLPVGEHGSTLHVACQQPALLGKGSLVERVCTRAADVLAHLLSRAQRTEKVGDLNRLQERVIQAEKLASLGQVVAGMVHELNNPLTSIIAYSDYLALKARQRGDAGEDVRDDLERLRRIGEAAERILKFSRELVAYARPAAEVPGPVDLEHVISKAVIFCEHEFAKSSVQVERCVPPNLPPLLGSAGQYTQVFVNLFTNAAHAMSSAGGVLMISAAVADDGRSITISVSDNGIGIAADDLSRIFEPFYTTKADGRGSGLGLSIVRDIVVSQGGTLTANSRVGVGTTFEVVLPVAKVAP